MTTWSTRYIRLNDCAADLARLEKAGLGDLHHDGAAPFAALIVAAPSLQPDDLAQLSKDFGEALSVQVHSVADVVVFDHFKAGSRTRGLTYAGEAGWVRVVGTPEPWEQPIFFAPARLDELLEELEEDCTDDAILKRETAELQRLWTGGKLEEGNTRPVAQWRALSQAVERHYGLPATSSNASTRLPKSKG